MISAIFLDFSETIVHGILDVNACRSSVVELLCSKGFQLSRAQYDHAIEGALYLRKIAKFEGKETSSEQMAKNMLIILNIVPNHQLISEIEDLEFKQYTWSVLSGVRKALTDLAKQFKLAVISNSTSDSVTRVLKKENLALFFDAVVLSKDVGYRKPDPRIFMHALNVLRVRPENALYVGDSFVQDVLGAKRCGMKTIWLNGKADTRSSHFDAVARSIDEVPAIISRLQKVDKFSSEIPAEAVSAV